MSGMGLGEALAVADSASQNEQAGFNFVRSAVLEIIIVGILARLGN
jgi:hypothetical protein